MRYKKINLDDFSPVGKKECQMKCDRDVIITKEGSVVICKACNRIVMDNRQK